MVAALLQKERPWITPRAVFRIARKNASIAPLCIMMKQTRVGTWVFDKSEANTCAYV